MVESSKEVERIFTKCASAEVNLNLNGFKTTHREDEIVIHYGEYLVGKLVYDSEVSNLALYLNKNDQGAEVNGVKVGLAHLLEKEKWPIKPVNF